MQILKRGKWVLACMLALGLTAGAQSQEPAPKPEEKKPPKKARKVWTQDDLASLRKPHDEYADKKAAEEAAAKAAAEQKQAQTQTQEATEQNVVIDSDTGKPYVDPDSPEGLELQLKRWEAALVSTEEALAAARTRLAQNTDPNRWETAKLEVDLLAQNVLDTQQRIEELKAKIAANPPKKDAAAAKAPSTPQP